MDMISSHSNQAMLIPLKRRRAMTSHRVRLSLAAALPAVLLPFANALATGSHFEVNDFPTEARAAYVIACMKANAPNSDLLKRCSCAMDVVASLLPYTDYQSADAALSAVKARKRHVETLRTRRFAQLFQKLQAADVEAEIRCF